jgi:dTDP-4-dehydrorhamnose 3,5-epimerase
MNIHDVQQVFLQQHEDDRGFLFEVIHASDPFVTKFGQVYFVGDRTPFTVRAYHKHFELHDWFAIVNGSAKFVLVDDRKDSPTYRKTDILIGSSRKPSLIIVPPGVYHGWMSLENDTLLCSIASHEYNREKPDEERVSPDSFQDILGQNPWQIIAK